MDTVFIKNLELQAVIGCLPWERRIKQRLLLSLELKTDHLNISKTDEIAQALDYARIAEQVRNFVAQTEYKLIETLIQKIADNLQSEFAITALRLILEKPGALPHAQTVGVTLERGF